MERFGLVKSFALVGILAAFMGGCSSVSKEKYDAAMQENSELRDRNTQLEQTTRDKDLRLADMEQRNNQQNIATAPSGGFAPAPTPQGGEDFRRVGNNMVAEISGDVLFDAGKASLKSSSKKQLDRIASQINGKYNGAFVRIEGHTDSDPIKKSSWPSNDALSQARADAVEKYLSSKGVSRSRLQSLGMGSKYPKGSKAASRRVDIVIVSGN